MSSRNFALSCSHLRDSFYPGFAAGEGIDVDVKTIANHVEHIANKIGKQQ